MKNVLTIGGSDCSGGAGIQADLKTFSALYTYGMSVVTAVTAQNTHGVISVREMDIDIIEEQINCLFEDIEIHAIKIGMVASPKIISAIGGCLKKGNAKNIVLDPVMVSKNGHRLLRDEGEQTLIKELFPLAKVVTPNLDEAEVLLGKKIRTICEMEEAAKAIHHMGAANVIVKGGHLADNPVDVLYNGYKFFHYEGKRINTKNTHGTGCTFSSAVAAFIAREYEIDQAVKLAKDYITDAIQNSIELGDGFGPTNHFYSLYKRAGLIEE